MGTRVAPLVAAFWRQRDKALPVARPRMRIDRLVRHDDVEGPQALAAAVVWEALAAADPAFFGLAPDADAEMVGSFWIELAGWDPDRIREMVAEYL